MKFLLSFVVLKTGVGRADLRIMIYIKLSA